MGWISFPVLESHRIKVKKRGVIARAALGYKGVVPMPEGDFCEVTSMHDCLCSLQCNNITVGGNKLMNKVDINFLMGNRFIVNKTTSSY